jgi:hypothetical protein
MVKITLSDIREDRNYLSIWSKKFIYDADGGRGEKFTLEHKTKISKALIQHMHSEASKQIGDSNRGATRHKKKKVKIVEFWER